MPRILPSIARSALRPAASIRVYNLKQCTTSSKSVATRGLSVLLEKHRSNQTQPVIELLQSSKIGDCLSTVLSTLEIVDLTSEPRIARQDIQSISVASSLAQG